MMTRINCMIVSFSLLSCSVAAMKSDGLTREEFGRMLGNMRPSDRLKLETSHENNVRKRNRKLEYEMQIESRRLSHVNTMDQESYLQRHGTPEEYFSYKYGVKL